MSLKDQRRRVRRVAIKHKVSVGVRGCEWRKPVSAARSTVALVQQFRSANSEYDPTALAFGGNLRPLARVQGQGGRIRANVIFPIDQNNARRRHPPWQKETMIAPMALTISNATFVLAMQRTANSTQGESHLRGGIFDNATRRIAMPCVSSEF